MVGNTNQAGLAYSDFGLQHRIIAAAGRRFAYANDKLATTVGLVFEAGQGNRFSYTYAGDLNRAALPCPSALPWLEPSPAIVVTAPAGVIFRIMWL